MTPTMERPQSFQMPSTESRALQALSPERVNTKQRPHSLIMSTAGLRTPKANEFEAQFLESLASPNSSPTRKANLFADYKAQKSPPGAGFGGMPLSPAMTEFNAMRSHGRNNSDVQGLVKRFEHLDVRDKDAESSEWRKKQEAELRRAQIAREEAESDVRRLREENRRMKRDCDEGRERENKIAKRIDVIQTESSNGKQMQASQNAAYEKEVRKARKEAFKSSSVVVKLQEELRSTRASLRITQSGLDCEKQKVNRREQETFNAQYQLAASHEELDQLRTQLKTVEEEREALKKSLKDEEVARIAAEGMIALPSAQDEDEDLLNSPRKSPSKRNISPLSDDKENMHAIPKKTIDNRRLEEELATEQMRREHAEEMVEFLTMECSFRCCSRRAPPMSTDIAKAVASLQQDIVNVLAPAKIEEEEDHDMEIDTRTEILPASPPPEKQVQEEMNIDLEPPAPIKQEAPLEEQLDRIMTLAPEEVPEERTPSMQPTEQEYISAPTPASPEIEVNDEAVESTPPSPQNQTPRTPPFVTQRSIRTVTTTTTVPMHFTPAAKPPQPIYAYEDDAENIDPAAVDEEGQAPTKPALPAGFDREAALAAIQYRRGRAKSIANGQMTPRKQMLEGVNGRRDISAPALGGKVGGVPSAVKNGSASVGRATGRRMH